jgi:DNA-binding transcriptional regulator YiaG
MSRQSETFGVIASSLLGDGLDTDALSDARGRYHWQLSDPERLLSETRSQSIVQVVRDLRQVIIAVSKNLETMQPEHVKAVRVALGLSQAAFGDMLRLGSHGKRTVIRWENGETPVPGPVSVAIEALEAGWTPGMTKMGDLPAGLLRSISDIESAVLQAQEHVRNIRRDRGDGQ